MSSPASIDNFGYVSFRDGKASFVDLSSKDGGKISEVIRNNGGLANLLKQLHDTIPISTG